MRLADLKPASFHAIQRIHDRCAVMNMERLHCAAKIGMVGSGEGGVPNTPACCPMVWRYLLIQLLSATKYFPLQYIELRFKSRMMRVIIAVYTIVQSVSFQARGFGDPQAITTCLNVCTRRGRGKGPAAPPGPWDPTHCWTKVWSHPASESVVLLPHPGCALLVSAQTSFTDS